MRIIKEKMDSVTSRLIELEENEQVGDLYKGMAERLQDMY